MIAVVTGSSGFIGSHLVRQLLASGATVRAVVRPQSSRTTRNPLVEYHEIDLLDAGAVAHSAVWTDATVLFHVAGLTKATSLAQFRLGNVQPLTNILSALSAHESPIRIVVVSSQAAAGPAHSLEQPVTEDDPPAPVESYGKSKREAELVAESYMDRLPITIVRPPAVYGPGDVDFLAAFKQATSSSALHATNPDHWFDLLYVADVISALVLAATEPRAVGRTYFLSSDSPVQWRVLYDMIAEASGSSPRHRQVPAWMMRRAAELGDVYGTVTNRTPLLNSQKLALAEPKFWLCSCGRIRDELGWRPGMTPQNGVRETYLWYVDAGWLSRKLGVTGSL